MSSFQLRGHIYSTVRTGRNFLSCYSTVYLGICPFMIGIDVSDENSFRKDLKDIISPKILSKVIKIRIF